MKLILLLVTFLLLGGCATSTRQTDALVKSKALRDAKTKISSVPFIKQKKNHCGPATMAMVMKHAGKSVTLAELNSQMMTYELEGTFQSEMIGAARRQGMMVLKIKDMRSMLKEISAGNPVIVFQNLGFSWSPQWHFAVALGHDLRGPDIILHSGKDKFLKQDMRLFERSWLLGGSWGIVVLNPHELSVTATEHSHLEAAAILESIGKLPEAQSAYKAIIQKWPRSLGALIGLGNVSYTRNNLKESLGYLSKAVEWHPQSFIAWNNLATVQQELGMKKKAKISTEKAISLRYDPSTALFK